MKIDLDKDGKSVKGIYFYVSEKEENDYDYDIVQGIKQELTSEEKNAVLDEVAGKLIATFKYTGIKDICDYAGYQDIKN